MQRFNRSWDHLRCQGLEALRRRLTLLLQCLSKFMINLRQVFESLTVDAIFHFARLFLHVWFIVSLDLLLRKFQDLRLPVLPELSQVLADVALGDHFFLFLLDLVDALDQFLNDIVVHWGIAVHARLWTVVAVRGVLAWFAEVNFFLGALFCFVAHHHGVGGNVWRRLCLAIAFLVNIHFVLALALAVLRLLSAEDRLRFSTVSRLWTVWLHAHWGARYMGRSRRVMFNSLLLLLLLVLNLVLKLLGCFHWELLWLRRLLRHQVKDILMPMSQQNIICVFLI